MAQDSPQENGNKKDPECTAPSQGQGATPNEPFGQSDDKLDNRGKWEWKSKYPLEAWSGIKTEGWILFVLLLTLIVISGLLLGLNGEKTTYHLFQIVGSSEATDNSQAATTGGSILTISFSFLAIFFIGGVGATTFSIKWLMHSVAKGEWHLDRRPWRYLVPIVGGVYASVVITLFDAGLLVGRASNGADVEGSGITFAVAFMVGYFSDGVSGLLSNVANAVFGTINKK